MAKVLNRRRLGAMACVLALASLTGCFGVVSRSGSGNGFALLTDVRSANNGTFDRTVFEFSGGKLPEWKIAYDAPPFIADGSGQTVKVSGHAYLVVTLTNADAHTRYSGPRRFSPPATPNVTELVQLGDFEGINRWVIGLTDFRKFNVTVMTSPSRLVVDVQH